MIGNWLRCHHCHCKSRECPDQHAVELAANSDGWVKGYTKNTHEIEYFCPACVEQCDDAVNVLHQYEMCY